MAKVKPGFGGMLLRKAVSIIRAYFVPLSDTVEFELRLLQSPRPLFDLTLISFREMLTARLSLLVVFYLILAFYVLIYCSIDF